MQGIGFDDRFKDAPWYKHFNVTIGGVGGIGSWLSLLLSRSGHSIYMYDFDIIEPSNIGGQLYSKHHVGKAKTQAAYEIIRDFAPGTSVNQMGKFEADSPVSNITFACFDRMAPRKAMFERWLHTIKIRTKIEGQLDPVIFMDGRMEAETAILYVVDRKSRIQRYQDELFDDSAVADAPCTFRATSHNPCILTGMMVSVLNNYITNLVEKTEVREVPFKIEYWLPTMDFISYR